MEHRTALWNALLFEFLWCLSPRFCILGWNARDMLSCPSWDIVSEGTWCFLVLFLVLQTQILRFVEVICQLTKQDTKPGLIYTPDWIFKQLAKLWASPYGDPPKELESLVLVTPWVLKLEQETNGSPGVRCFFFLDGVRCCFLSLTLAQGLEVYLHMQWRLEEWSWLGFSSNFCLLQWGSQTLPLPLS